MYNVEIIYEPIKVEENEEPKTKIIIRRTLANINQNQAEYIEAKVNIVEGDTSIKIIHDKII